MKLVFQSSTIDVLPLKRTSTGFILSKNNEKKTLLKKLRKVASRFGGPE